jgi:ribose transport system permease protein
MTSVAETENEATLIPGARRRRRRPGGVAGVVGRYGVLVALVATIGVFCALRPDTFATASNFEVVLAQMAPAAVVSFGLTVVLVMGDFDLSVVGVIGLSSAIVVSLMSKEDVPLLPALLVALALAVAVGLLDGTLIAGIGASSFIITLASGQVFEGVELQVTHGQTIFENIPSGFLDIATTDILGLQSAAWLALAVFLILYLVLDHSQLGRYMYAIGGNPEAARLSGISVKSVRTLGFVIVSVCAMVAAVILTSRAGAYSNEIGTSFFLPTYAAVFLGAAVLRPGTFNLPGTLVGALFLEVIANGLTLLELSFAIVLIIQGAILAAAVMLSTVQRRAA